MKSSKFIRALMTSVCESAISGLYKFAGKKFCKACFLSLFLDLLLKLCLTGSGSSARVAPEIIKARGDVLHKYLDHQAASELQALFALQALVHKLEHPQGVFLTSYVFVWNFFKFMK